MNYLYSLPSLPVKQMRANETKGCAQTYLFEIPKCAQYNAPNDCHLYFITYFSCLRDFMTLAISPIV